MHAASEKWITSTAPAQPREQGLKAGASPKQRYDVRTDSKFMDYLKKAPGLDWGPGVQNLLSESEGVAGVSQQAPSLGASLPASALDIRKQDITTPYALDLYSTAFYLQESSQDAHLSLGYRKQGPSLGSSDISQRESYGKSYGKSYEESYRQAYPAGASTASLAEKTERRGDSLEVAERSSEYSFLAKPKAQSEVTGRRQDESLEAKTQDGSKAIEATTKESLANSGASNKEADTQARKLNEVKKAKAAMQDAKAGHDFEKTLDNREAQDTQEAKGMREAKELRSSKETAPGKEDKMKQSEQEKLDQEKLDMETEAKSEAKTNDSKSPKGAQVRVHLDPSKWELSRASLDTQKKNTQHNLSTQQSQSHKTAQKKADTGISGLRGLDIRKKGDAPQGSQGSLRKLARGGQKDTSAHFGLESRVATHSQSTVSQGVHSDSSMSGLSKGSFREIYDRLVQKAKINIRSNGSSTAHIRLQPAALGAMTLNLGLINKRVQAKITVENQAVQKLVQEEMSYLRLELQRQGIQFDFLSIRVREGAQDTDRLDKNHLAKQDFRDSKENNENEHKQDQETGSESRRRLKILQGSLANRAEDALTEHVASKEDASESKIRHAQAHIAQLKRESSQIHPQDSRQLRAEMDHNILLSFKHSQKMIQSSNKTIDI